MKTRWLQQNRANSVLVLFGGWAVGPGVFSGISGDMDVLFVDEYQLLDVDMPDLSGYDRITLLAYSFGVAAAGWWMANSDVPLARKVAVNGTLHPADPRRGIGARRIHATADGLDAAGFATFCHMAGMDVPDAEIDYDVRRAELRAVADRPAAPEATFDRIWIARSDRIILAAHQRRAWQGQAQAIREVDGGHVPFAASQTWEAWLK